MASNQNDVIKQLCKRISMMSDAQVRLLLQVAEQMMPKTSRRLYKTWNNIQYRCNNPRDHKYNYYGGKGIKVCKEWEQSFEAFESWAWANGYAENLTIDRIDPDKDYAPDNCRWATMKEQQNNKRHKTVMPMDSDLKTENSVRQFNRSKLAMLIDESGLARWALAQKLGVHPKTLLRKIREGGWTEGELAVLAEALGIDPGQFFTKKAGGDA